MTIKEQKYYFKCLQISAFFATSLAMGYNYCDAWDLLLNSRQGQGILAEDWVYLTKHSGAYSAEEADSEIGYRYKKQSHIQFVPREIKSFGKFIENMHKMYKINYKDMFIKYSLDDFMSENSFVLGNYDRKLYEKYFL